MARFSCSCYGPLSALEAWITGYKPEHYKLGLQAGAGRGAAAAIAAAVRRRRDAGGLHRRRAAPRPCRQRLAP